MENTWLKSIKLLVGLGNVGKKYQLNRHNAGFLFVDHLQSSWQEQSKFKSFVAELTIDGHKLILAKPTTLMNLSGEAVTLLKNYYKVADSEIAVAHDDLDIALGDYKIQLAKGPKVHNGLSSINKMLGSEDYWRIRIGIENREVKGNRGIPGMTYALQNFQPAELTTLKATFVEILKA